MNNIRDIDYLVNEIICSIKDLECYKNYLFFKSKLDESPGLKEKINQFKKMQTEIYALNQSGQKADFNTLLTLDKFYSDIMISEEGMGFINSERDVKKEIAAIIEAIADGFDIEDIDS